MAGCLTPSVFWRFERATSVLKRRPNKVWNCQNWRRVLFVEQTFWCLTGFTESDEAEVQTLATGDTITDINTRRWEMCCSRETIFSQVTHIYPISELGQNNVDYWTHLMLKTNTSYFTGSSQLNNRFFFHSCNTLRNIHSHGCIQTIFSLFDFSFNNIKSTNRMHLPFVWQWSR